MPSSRFRRPPGKAALSTLFLSTLAACGGGGSGGGNGTPPPPVTTSHLAITGTVTDAPIASAVVTATVGGQTFTGTADANGNYRVDLSIPETATGGFVTLTAKGVGSQSYVEFTSPTRMAAARRKTTSSIRTVTSCCGTRPTRAAGRFNGTSTAGT